MKDILNAIIICAVFGFFIWVREGAQETKAQMREERECLESAITRQDMEECFALMERNKKA